jgi:hypothetical protein
MSFNVEQRQMERVDNLRQQQRAQILLVKNQIKLVIKKYLEK